MSERGAESKMGGAAEVKLGHRESKMTCVDKGDGEGVAIDCTLKTKMR